jgi:hypothetical protein
VNAPGMPRSFAATWRDPERLAQAARTMNGLDFLRAIRDGRLPVSKRRVSATGCLTQGAPRQRIPIL